MSQLQTVLPSIPSFLRLRIFLVFSSGLAIAALTLPVRLSLVFGGTIRANGPTTMLLSTTEGTITSLPEENKLLERNDVLFRFQQPVLAADLEVLRVQAAGLDRRLTETRKQCKTQIQGAKRNVTNSQETYTLYQQAYSQKAISQVVLLGHRDAVDSAKTLLEDQRAQCLKDISQISNELAVTREQIVKQQSTSQFEQELKAPDTGSMHGLMVKIGQRVGKGQLLGQFTAIGSTGAELVIPVQDRPFVAVGDEYTVYSQAYAFLVNPPQRQCRIASITPDVVTGAAGSPVQAPSYFALCHFEQTTLNGPYPLLVGMPVDAYGISVQASLIQLLIRGYRDLVTPKPPTQSSSNSR